MSHESAPDTPLHYVLDATDRIVRVNPHWDRFAQHNQAEHLLGSRVIGTQLWEHITDGSVTDIYHSLLERARRGREISVRFRCDSADVARLLRLTLRGDPLGNVECETTLESERPTMHIPLWDPSAERGPRVVIACSWCKRVRIAGGWYAPEEGVRVLGLFEGRSVPLISHSVCDDCEKQLLGGQ